MDKNPFKKEFAMKRQVLIFSFGLLCTIFPTLLNASACSTLIKNIHQDVGQYSNGNSITGKRLAWMNIYWLKKRLGRASISKNLDTATGDPDKQQLQYTWHCPENEDTQLVAVANSKGLVTFIEGQYSSDAGAELFSAMLPQNRVSSSQMPTPITTPTAAPPPPIPEPNPAPKPEPAPAAKTEESTATDSLAALLNPYNEYFHTTIHTKENLVNDMISKMQFFYKNLRDCTPGIYRYSIYLQSGFIFPVSTIQGASKGTCQVETLFSVPQLGKINAKCNYPQKSLSVYTDDEAEALVKGKSFDKNNPSPRDKIEAEACDTYVNGKLQSKLVKS